MAKAFLRQALLATAGIASVASDNTMVRAADAAAAAVASVVRISCVGDSLTEGFHASNSDQSYPSLLQGLLGSSYLVMNFGHSGSTLTGPQQDYPSKVPYSHTKEYTNSLLSEPDIVVIMIGSNDASQLVWPVFHQDFESAYANLIGVYRALPTRPMVFIAVPPPLYKNHAYGMLQSVINNGFPAAMQRIAGTNRLLPPISIFEAFRSHCPNLNSDHCPLISAARLGVPSHDDGCHPNDAGYLLIASTVKSAILPLVQVLGGFSTGLQPLAQTVPSSPAAAQTVPRLPAGAQGTREILWYPRRRLQHEATVQRWESQPVLV